MATRANANNIQPVPGIQRLVGGALKDQCLFDARISCRPGSTETVTWRITNWASMTQCRGFQFLDNGNPRQPVIRLRKIAVDQVTRAFKAGETATGITDPDGDWITVPGGQGINLIIDPGMCVILDVNYTWGNGTPDPNLNPQNPVPAWPSRTIANPDLPTAPVIPAIP